MFPNDPFILLSYINTQLRDEYSSFAELCASAGEDCVLIEEKLKSIGFTYDSRANQFK